MAPAYRQGRLHFGDQDLVDLMETRTGLPCYVYSFSAVRERAQQLKKRLAPLTNLNIHYALKANAHSEILQVLKQEGAGADVVSGGELKHAMKCGFAGKDIIFSGVGKSAEEIDLAIDRKIKQINVESPQELVRIAERGEQKGRRVPVALRMNPEVNPVTHPYITTGMSENKFGMDSSFVPELVQILRTNAQWLELRGLTMHIGSQLLDLSAMSEAIKKLRSLAHDMSLLGFPIRSLDVGGGVGIHYAQADWSEDIHLLDQYGEMMIAGLKDFPGEVMIEPGRFLVARAGLLLCQVEYIKTTPFKKFVIVNTGMHHLMRPALYQAEHRLLPLREPQSQNEEACDVVGPICESSDFIAKNRPMPPLQQGDYLAICDAGAYGFTMANNYNLHGLPEELVLP